MIHVANFTIFTINSRSTTNKKKHNVKHREAKGENFRKGDSVSDHKQLRNANPGYMRKWRTRRKKKKKKGQFMRDERATNQQLFKRRLLMMLLEPELEYDADGWAGRHDAEDFRESARENQVMAESEVDFNRLQFQTGQDYMDCRPNVDSGQLHIRGGQDCLDCRHPPNIDIIKYHQSAHCLRFSDLW